MTNVAPAKKAPTPGNIRYTFGDLYWEPTDLTDPINGYGTHLGIVSGPIIVSPNRNSLNISDETLGVEIADKLDIGMNPVIFALLAEHKDKTYELGFAPHHVSTGYKYISRASTGKLRSDLKSGKLLYVPYDRSNHNCILVYKALPELDSAARLQRTLAEALMLPVVFQAIPDSVGNVIREALLADLTISTLTISNVASGSVTSSSATITWDTNRNATSKVKYGTSNGGPYSLFKPNPWVVNSVTSHSVNLTGLSAATTYYYVVESYDAEGNYAVSSQSSFVTA